MITAPSAAPRGTLAAGSRIRVLIVDDSVVIRHLLREALESDPRIEVVGAEGDGVAALAKIPILQPDVVTLDIEMPQMNGIETLKRIRKDFPRLRTVMFSTLTTRGAAATFEALSLGADDYVAKASNGGKLDESLASLRSELLPKIRQFLDRTESRSTPKVEAKRSALVRKPVTAKPRVLAIGVSTGGPNALARLIPFLPAEFPLPILLVQHMPATFTRLLAERLNSTSPLEVLEAENGLQVRPGRVIIARGDYHLRVRQTGPHVTTVLDQGPRENSCRPAVDVLFRSAAQVYGSVLSVVLTGMGYDGLRGTEAVKAANGYSIVQDQATSVVWGMPGAVADAGLADQVLPLNDIAGELLRVAGR